jgi:two-component system NarL family sensor kinase
VARELHDSIGQYFVSLKMNFDVMRSEPSAAERERILEDCRDLLDRGIVEARTLSDLLHPPLLDEAGFLSAARWHVEGFTDRSKIQVKLDAPDDLPAREGHRTCAIPGVAGKPY